MTKDAACQENVDENTAEYNMWSSLPFPLHDIFLQGVVVYLTVEEFIMLGAVCTRYHQLLNPKSSHGNRILGCLLQQDAKHYHPVTRELLHAEQLPTIGGLSIEQSLEEDAVLVAQLRMSASRRRALLVLPNKDNHNADSLNDNDDTRNLWLGQCFQDKAMRQYRPRSLLEVDTIGRRYGLYLSPATMTSELLCINLSDRDVYCKTILGSGEFRFLPKAPARSTGIRSFVQHEDEEGPENNNVAIFKCRIYSSYALYYHPGGAPFAIYQPRRGWYRIGVGLDNGVMQTHAIAVRNNGVIEELHCESTWNLDPETAQTYRSYDFIHRQTGIPVPHGENNETLEIAPDDTEEAKELTKTFYGLNVPPFLEQLTRQPGDGLPRSLNTRVGEAIWHEDHHGGESA